MGGPRLIRCPVAFLVVACGSHPAGGPKQPAGAAAPGEDSAPAEAKPDTAPEAEEESEGYLSPEAIRDVVRDRWDAFRGCYEAGLKRDPKLTGKVYVKFVIERDGSTDSVQVDSATLPDQKVVDCLLGEYRALRFPPPEGGTVTVVYPTNFEPGGAEEEKTRGKLPPGVVQKTVGAASAQFGECYQAGLDRNPKLSGRITVRFIIATDGMVEKAELVASEIKDRKVTDCVLEESEKLQFPAPNGGRVSVVYPLTFSQPGGSK